MLFREKKILVVSLRGNNVLGPYLLEWYMNNNSGPDNYIKIKI